MAYNGHESQAGRCINPVHRIGQRISIRIRYRYARVEEEHFDKLVLPEPDDAGWIGEPAATRLPRPVEAVMRARQLAAGLLQAADPESREEETRVVVAGGAGGNCRSGRWIWIGRSSRVACAPATGQTHCGKRHQKETRE